MGLALSKLVLLGSFNPGHTHGCRNARKGLRKGGKRRDSREAAAKRTREIRMGMIGKAPE